MIILQQLKLLKIVLLFIRYMYISEEEDFDFIKIILNRDDEICRHSSIKSLMKYNLDKLKIKCKERNISIDGTKHELAERIIITDNNYIKIILSVNI